MLDRKAFAATLANGEQAVFFGLHESRDSLIETLYRRVEAGNHKLPGLKSAGMVRRYKQQRVGAYISRINYKLIPKGYIIRPGESRHSYRIYRLRK